MKNRVIYKYLSLHDALRVICYNTLKFSHPSAFNDPFDCYEELLKFVVTESFLKSHLDKGILSLDDSEKKLTVTELVTHLKKNTYTFNNKDTKAVFEDVMKRIWISCFSKTYKEILMWSHYADDHKGICIGFNYYGLSKTIDFKPIEVVYKNGFKKFDYCSDEVMAINYLVSTKSCKWSYEQEIRLLTMPDKAVSMSLNGIASIHPSSISEIIIGCNCPVNPSNIRNRLVRMNLVNVRLIQMSKSKNSYKLKEKIF